MTTIRHFLQKVCPRLPGLAALLCCDALASAGDVVINEIMYHPPNDLEQAQYVELFNRGAQTINLGGWAFTRGIRYTFPEGTQLPPGGFLVVCRDRRAFATHYGNSARLLGNFDGKLSHSGDRVELCDVQKRVVDAVKYSDRDGWPTAPDGYSASLERICPDAPSEGVANWAPSRLRSPTQPGGTPGRQNDAFSAALPPAIGGVKFTRPAPGSPVTVTAEVNSLAGVRSAVLLHSMVAGGRESTEAAVPMSRVAGDDRRVVYEGRLPAPPEGQLVRFRVRATDVTGAQRVHPSENEPRPTFSSGTFARTNDAQVPFGFVFHVAAPEGRAGGRPSTGASAAFGNGAYVHLPVGGGEAQIFDHVGLTPRRGGFKVRFQKDRMLDGISTLNVVYEGSPRYPLSEVLAYELFRLAGVPAPLAGHVRLWEDGRPRGYQLTFEQPNKSFLRRNGRDDTGNLYKSMYGNYQKRSNPATGRGDLEALIQGLNRRQGAEQWRFIETNFNVGEMISHYAVNLCIQNWDGFFNNHYAYHDTGGTGRWEIYPWDEDKTWGDYDGASPRYDWYTMPLTFGMNGDSGTGEGWWRGPGEISGPLLANPEFRNRFLARLRELCEKVFTPAKLFPVIDALGVRLEPEIEARARLTGENPESAKRRFHEDLQSFRNQVERRQRFMLGELDRIAPARR